jgi:recombination protein RecR
MIKQLPSLQDLIRRLQRIPFLASRNIYRIALHLISCSEDELESFCASMMKAKERIKPCSICCNWTEGTDICDICSSKSRDKSLICVIETWHDLQSIEMLGDYKGLYHVLGGALCPLEGIGPEKLHIEGLIKRINKETKEVIFATNATPEGEATASFIASKLSEKPVLISRLASGMPIGSSLEYMDRVTIHKALSGRRPF